MAESVFKACPCCGNKWSSRDLFFADPNLNLNGYQADFELLEEGLFLFTHMQAPCGSTMAIPAKNFTDLYSGARYHERKSLSAECPRYCLDREQLSRCNALCECAYIREVIQIIRERSGTLRSREGTASEVP